MLMDIKEYKLTKRGIVHVKGKGDVNTYWLNEHIHEHPDHPPPPTTHQVPKTPTIISYDAVNTNTPKPIRQQSPAITNSFSPINSELEPLIPAEA